MSDITLKSDAKPKKAQPQFYKILMEDSEAIPPAGQFFALNGRNWYLKGGHTYVVPLGLKVVLDNAVESYAVQNPDTKQVVGYRDKLRFPYRLLGQSDNPDDLTDD